jgi:hypothetical protein
MSAGGVFKLIANDGKPDRLLLATALLNQRILDVACARRRANKDPTPTLLDIERTHILFVNAHFKPFAAIGYEYNKVRTGSGSASLGGTVQFSIPQFGDFFHDMVLRAVMSECFVANTTAAPSPAVTSTSGPYSLANTYPDTTTTARANWDGAALGATFITAYELVDAFGTSVADGATYRNMIRYVEYPAERLCAKVKFDVNGNPLDEYTYRVASMLRKFCVSDEKMVGYQRLVGQEVPFEGHSGPRVCVVEDVDYDTTAPAAATLGSGVSAGAHAGSFLNEGITAAAYMATNRYTGGDFAPNQWQNNAAITQAAQTQVNVGAGSGTASTNVGVPGPSSAEWGHVQREVLTAVDGPQTPKYWQPSTELWNRLWFWFNLDARLSVPSVAIPYGQRFITVELCTAAELLTDFPGIFVQQTVTTTADITTTASSTGQVTRNFRPFWQSVAVTAPTISSFELYINNIFVNPEVHDIFIRRVGFSLIRVFRVHTASKSQGTEDQELLSQLKWPIEYLFVGFQPQFNTNTSTNQNYYRDWHRMGKSFNSIACVRQSAIISTTDIAPTASVTKTMSSNIGQLVPDTYVIDRPTVTTISLTAHGIKIHDGFSASFFSSYTPFHYGGDAIRPSRDPGALMINFALFPGCYQPSAYLNTSRARELYLSWTTSYIGSTTPVTLVAVGVAINFLLVTDGSAVLRYST